jgi:radical SAM protein with 4Fe4S-binding SPASM domain
VNGEVEDNYGYCRQKRYCQAEKTMNESKPSKQMIHSHPHANQKDNSLRLVAWETTRNCNLACIHCRASATSGPHSGELDTQESFRLLDQITETGHPIIIPKAIAQKLAAAGIQRISVSLDGATAQSHDSFRKVDGAFEGTLKGIQLIKEAGIEFQINTTITKTNLEEIPKIQQLAVDLEAVAHHIFLLVPTGRGKYIVDQEITAAEYEQTLNWFYDQSQCTPLQLKATCAPHYYRILRQRAKEEGKSISFKTHGLDAVTRGCLGGIGFCFISHRGIVQPCGYLDLNCGDVRQTSFADIWNHSKIFSSLRNFDNLEGKCGYCEFKKVCGGCRARAYEATGDYLTEEPLCNYQPKAKRKTQSPDC